MKTDRYLNLCLEQAVKSSLRHRHGCVVVKGGKIIGQGFNDIRSGFDGGVDDQGDAHLDQSLSMHAEMMAIHAVIASAAGTARAKQRIGHDVKRNHGMHREAVQTYAERVLLATFGPSPPPPPPQLPQQIDGLAASRAQWGFEPSRCQAGCALSRGPKDGGSSSSSPSPSSSPSSEARGTVGCGAQEPRAWVAAMQ